MPEYIYFLDYDPDWGDECEICVYFRYGECHAHGETDKNGDCPSFKDE